MTIQVGDAIPDVTLKTMGEKGPEDITTSAIFKGRKVAFFAVPGAFTPTCSRSHLPSCVANADKLTAKGVDAIACVSVNDVFVMNAWGKSANAGDIMMLADPDAALAKALGVELDASAHGMGLRSARYSLVADDGKVAILHLEKGGAYEVSSAEALLEAL